LFLFVASGLGRGLASTRSLTFQKQKGKKGEKISPRSQQQKTNRLRKESKSQHFNHREKTWWTTARNLDEFLKGKRAQGTVGSKRKVMALNKQLLVKLGGKDAIGSLEAEWIFPIHGLDKRGLTRGVKCENHVQNRHRRPKYKRQTGNWKAGIPAVIKCPNKLRNLRTSARKGTRI